MTKLSPTERQLLGHLEPERIVDENAREEFRAGRGTLMWGTGAPARTVTRDGRSIPVRR